MPEKFTLDTYSGGLLRLHRRPPRTRPSHWAAGDADGCHAVPRHLRCIDSSAGKSVNPFDRSEVVVPVRTAGETDMCVGSYVDLAIKGPCWNDQKTIVCLTNRQCGTAIHAKALNVLRPRKLECLDVFLTCNPSDLCLGRKQVCRMGRAAALATAGAMAKKEILKLSRYAKLHSTTQALSGS